MPSAIWILGDQLTHKHPALLGGNKSRDRVVMIESRACGAHLRYHKIKLAMVYSAMRHFAEELRAEGWSVDYHEMAQTPDFLSAWKVQASSRAADEIVVMEPNSLVERQVVSKISQECGLTVRFLPPVQFLRSREDFIAWARGKQRLLMEQHYRTMRERLGLLTDSAGNPEGGRWNLDAENRKQPGNGRKSAARSQVRCRGFLMTKRPEG